MSRFLDTDSIKVDSVRFHFTGEYHLCGSGTELLGKEYLSCKNPGCVMSPKKEELRRPSSFLSVIVQ